MHSPKLALFGGLSAGVVAVVVAWARRERQARVRAERLAAERRSSSKLALRLLADPLPAARGKEAPQGAYLFHQLDDHLPSTTAAAAALVSKYPGMPLLVLDVRNDRLRRPIPNGFGGGPALLEALRAAGIDGSTPESQVLVEEWDHEANPMSHTLIEAELAVRFAKRRGWTCLLVVAPPFHLPRAAMTAASVAGREYPELRVAAFPGRPLPWEETAAHSQGMRGTRYDFLDSELDRIELYTAKGDIAPPQELEARFWRHEPGFSSSSK